MRRSSIGKSCTATTRSLLDRERRADDGRDVLQPARRVAEAVVADIGRVPGRDLVDAERAGAHPPELSAEALDEDVRPPARLGGGGGERLELRLLQIRRDEGERVGRDVDPLLEQTADRK